MTVTAIWQEINKINKATSDMIFHQRFGANRFVHSLGIKFSLSEDEYWHRLETSRKRLNELYREEYRVRDRN